MKEKQLKPIKLSPRFNEKVEAEILSFLTEALFTPIIEQMELVKKIYFNSNGIEDAIRSGKIQFSDGIFKGEFNATTSKEFRALGVKFDKRIKGYRKELSNLPISIQTSIAQTASNYEKMAQAMIGVVDSLNINLLENLEELDFIETFDQVINSVDKQFRQTVTKSIGIEVDITESQRKTISGGFSNNLKLSIKDFADEQIPILREGVEKAVFSGIRAESLQKVIVDRFGVSESKAKFLAKQETSLLTSKYKQAKYQEAGINKYKWSISNVRTRPDHRALNGKIFSFDDPPITNQDTGARNSPGEDFGCNCVAMPIVEV